MGVHAVGFGVSAVNAAGSFGGGNDLRLKTLEQKLQQLTQEKKKAEENKDEDKVKKLEQQIENVKRQIEQWKRKQEKETEEPGVSVQRPENLPAGDHVDMTV